ncbi:13085_t:CDS:1, partial [Racocetra persica]
IIEFKNILVHMIQTKLKTSTQQVGRQVIMIPCLESQFVSVFNKYINRYSPSRSWYQCIFTGIGAYKCLEQILNDEKWG